MSDSAVDKTVFAFLSSCVGDFVQWPQCSVVTLNGNNEGGCLSGVFFKAMAMNPADRTVFRIIVTKDNEWRIRVVQLSNHVVLDECNADRGAIMGAVDRFTELAGMVEGRES